MYKTTDIYPAKTTALLSMFLGGQFEPVSGGQFEMAGGGQFLLAEGGQFAWIFQLNNEIAKTVEKINALRMSIDEIIMEIENV